MNAEHEKYGSNCGGSRWFNTEPILKETEMIPVKQHWMCPIDNCGGEMLFNGTSWPTVNPGYHHTCNKCGFTAAVSGKTYPAIFYRDKEE